jgi:hypothetical protein
VSAFACGCGALVAAGFRQVIYDDRLTEVAGVPVWLPTVAGGLVLAVTAAAAPAVRRAGFPRGTTDRPEREADGGHDR